MLVDFVERLLARTRWGMADRLVADWSITVLVVAGSDHALALAGALRQRLERERTGRRPRSNDPGRSVEYRCGPVEVEDPGGR